MVSWHVLEYAFPSKIVQGLTLIHVLICYVWCALKSHF